MQSRQLPQRYLTWELPRVRARRQKRLFSQKRKKGIVGTSAKDWIKMKIIFGYDNTQIINTIFYKYWKRAKSPLCCSTLHKKERKGSYGSKRLKYRKSSLCNQCEQMARLFFNFGHLYQWKLAQWHTKFANVGPRFSQIVNKPTKIWPRLILPNWRNFTKSGHTVLLNASFVEFGPRQQQHVQNISLGKRMQPEC